MPTSSACRITAVLSACLHFSFCVLFFVAPFASLLQDHETEVRAATIKDISSFVDLVGPPTFASEVMPYVLALLQDVNLVGAVDGHAAWPTSDQE